MTIRRMVATISGAVQGVGFREFAKSIAEELGLRGFAENRADGRVQIVVEGPETDLASFFERLRRVPDVGFIDKMDLETKESTGGFADFEARRKDASTEFLLAAGVGLAQLGVVRAGIDNLRTDVQGVRDEVRGVREEVRGVSDEVKGVRVGVDSLNMKMDGLSSTLESRFDRLDDGQVGIRTDIRIVRESLRIIETRDRGGQPPSAER